MRGGLVESELDRRRIKAWIKRKRRLPAYGFHADVIAREVGLPLAVVEAHLREMTAAGEVVVRLWDVSCGRCGQLHDFSMPEAVEGEVCLRCGEELDSAQAVPLYGLR